MIHVLQHELTPASFIASLEGMHKWRDDFAGG
jgi:hypothetical protein